jgi:NodT family efflux transporter outer membrane factor (OMF) lipoprotein
MMAALSRPSAAALLIVVVLAGCTRPTDPHRIPRLEYLDTVPQDFDDPEAAFGRIGPVAQDSEAGLDQWWLPAGDPALNALLARADDANNDIMVASARLAQVSAARKTAAAAQLPSLGASLQYDRRDSVRGAPLPQTGNYNAQLDLGWDPDLFGRLRSNAQAARADLAAAGFDVENIRRLVRNEVVRTYVSYRAVEARLAYVALSAKTQHDILDMVERRYQLGISVETDRQQARLQWLQVIAIEPQLRNERNQLRNRLAVLLGGPTQPLDEMLGNTGVVPLFAAPPQIGIPMDLVRNRPDVRAAEGRLLAAGERIGAARAALLPQITLNGTLSTFAPTPSGLFESIIAQTLGRVVQSLFAGGAARAAVEQNKAAADEALALYRNSILTALESTENALSAVRTSQARMTINREALEAAELAAAQARLQNELGLIDFYVVLAAEQNLLAQRDELVLAQAANAIAIADLHASLGNRLGSNLTDWAGREQQSPQP